MRPKGHRTGRVGGHPAGFRWPGGSAARLRSALGRFLYRVVGLAGSRRHEAALVRLLPDTLERVAGGLRAGASPLVALTEAAGGSDLPPALCADLARVVERAEQEGLEPALAAWAGERPLSAIATAAAALQVTAGAGGPAAPALERLAGALRDRHDVAAEADALSAQARLSAIVVGASPLVSLTLSLLVDRRVAATLMTTSSGRACLFAGVALEALAAAWMRRIVRVLL